MRGGIGKTYGFLTLGLVALLSGAVGGRADIQSLIERLEQTIPVRMSADDVAGAVVVVMSGGSPVWTGGFGHADTETGRPMTENALFRVESISKPVTAWGVMRLSETGRLDLDAPITDCLNIWRPPEGSPKMTARQLLTHSAGIGLGDYAARYTPDAPRPILLDYLTEDFRMIGAPGHAFAYSNTGYNLLELVIEDCAGVDFAAFMRRDVLVPLGMRTASFNWIGAKMPLGHDLRGRPVAPYVYPGRGSGGLFATANDVARFAAAGMVDAKQDVLSSPSVETLHQLGVAVTGLFGFAADGYGLGHFTETLSDGRAAVWHGGQGYGWMSHMHFVPDSGEGIVILANSQRAWPLFAMILRDWSVSLGVNPVGMARVLWAETGARVLIGLMLAVSLLALWSVVAGRPVGRAARFGAGVVGSFLILWPLWAGMHEYLFLFSILPGLWGWLAAVSVLTGLALSTVALSTRRRA